VYINLRLLAWKNW